MTQSYAKKTLFLCNFVSTNPLITMKRLKTLFVLAATAFTAAAAPSARDAEPQFTVVIDAGHGGKDYGCIGKVANEKTITLDVAKRLAQRIDDESPKTRTVLTRNTDRYLTLQQRADVANRAHGDLFISIHVNSIDRRSKGRENVTGAQVYTLGADKADKNIGVAMRENSVIELEDDYTTRYAGFDPSSAESYIIFELGSNLHLRQSIDFAQMAQQALVNEAGRADKGVHQAGFWVLWASAMPAVLVELDFICNPQAEAFLNTPDGRQKCADALYDAFADYQTAFLRKSHMAQAPTN